MTKTLFLVLASSLALIAGGCGDSDLHSHDGEGAQSHDGHDHDGHDHDDDGDHDGHDHDDDGDHDGHDHGDDGDHDGHDHSNEASLGTTTIGEFTVELAQGHGGVAAEKEGHLVVKLPYNDKGETEVRAWIGTEDKVNSIVGRGEYAAGHDDYDVHAMAPESLPENTMWWIQLTLPDGTRIMGSAKPIFD